MKAGILLPQTGELARRENILYIGREAERVGLDSVWVFERLYGQSIPRHLMAECLMLLYQ
jgi:hypothetical protein